MKVNQAFRRRSTLYPNEHGTWGNDSIESMLKEFPLLSPLVRALQGEPNWSSGRKTLREWSALFFVDYVRNQKTRVVLEIRPSSLGLEVPSLEIDLDQVPSLEDVKKHIIATIRRHR